MGTPLNMLTVAVSRSADNPIRPSKEPMRSSRIRMPVAGASFAT